MASVAEAPLSPKSPPLPSSGEIRSNFKIHFILTKTCLSYLFWSQDSKNVIYFYVHHLEMPKIHFKKVTSSSPLLLIFDLYTAKYKDSLYNIKILEAIKHLRLFYPKSRNMTPLKRHFLKTFSTIFF